MSSPPAKKQKPNDENHHHHIDASLILENIPHELARQMFADLADLNFWAQYDGLAMFYLNTYQSLQIIGLFQVLEK